MSVEAADMCNNIVIQFVFVYILCMLLLFVNPGCDKSICSYIPYGNQESIARPCTYQANPVPLSYIFNLCFLQTVFPNISWAFPALVAQVWLRLFIIQSLLLAHRDYSLPRFISVKFYEIAQYLSTSIQLPGHISIQKWACDF